VFRRNIFPTLRVSLKRSNRIHAINSKLVRFNRNLSTDHSCQLGVGLSDDNILSARGASAAAEPNLRE
jgi:hypothetical protein